MALRHREGQWHLHTLALNVFPEEAREESPRFTYDYGQAAFLAGVTTGAKAVAWLRSSAGEVNGIGELPDVYHFQVPSWHESVGWRKYRSHETLYDSPLIRWPFYRYEVSSKDSHNFQNGDQDLLVSDGCPFFPNLQTAFAQLIFGIANWDQVHNLTSSEQIIVRFAQTDAWIESIHITPTSLDITVAGTNAAGVRLEVIGPPEVPLDRIIEQEGVIKWLLPKGVPGQYWIVLSRGKEWLDNYHWDQRWAWMHRQKSQVTVEPPDYRTQIEALITQGEGLTIDLKEVLPPERDKWLKTIAAFANHAGGVILVGVDDDGNLVGVSSGASTINEMKDSISRTIRGNLVPCPEFEVEHYELKGKQVIAISVQKGALPPYGIHPDKPVFYVRRGANSFPARHDEIRALAQLQLASSEPAIGTEVG